METSNDQHVDPGAENPVVPSPEMDHTTTLLPTLWIWNGELRRRRWHEQDQKEQMLREQKAAAKLLAIHDPTIIAGRNVG
jgi:hypothetical protein